MQERLETTVQRRIVHAIREEITRTVQQQVSECNGVYSVYEYKRDDKGSGRSGRGNWLSSTLVKLRYD
jgi:hypothetical protein